MSGRGRGILSPAQIAEAIEWIEAGKPMADLVRRFGVTESAIDSHCRKAGVSRSGGKQLRPPPAEPRTYVRAGQTVRCFTAAEDEQLRQLEAERLSLAEIGRRMGRNPQTIKARLVTLALHDEARESA
jgi:DNA-binding CsgD family transcriptional regulator